MQAEADRLLARKVSDEVCHLRIASMCNKHMYQLKSGRSAFFFLHDGRILRDRVSAACQLLMRSLAERCFFMNLGLWSFWLLALRISAEIQKEKDTCRPQMPLLKNSDFSP